ncbi:hypothetical protein EPO34_03215 [Patescibacteria group bacterium]|nr:MAG: hypothetical protein EPO34_03215 [Patescibacteria group bacterium]
MPIAILLILYALFVVFFVVYGGFTWYHLSRFGVAHGHLVAMQAVFLVGSIALLGASALAILSYDWTATVTTDDLDRLIGSIFQTV